jgi:hypothetical protein
MATCYNIGTNKYGERNTMRKFSKHRDTDGTFSVIETDTATGATQVVDDYLTRSKASLRVERETRFEERFEAGGFESVDYDQLMLDQGVMPSGYNDY